MESMIERVARAIAIDTENGDIALWPQFTSTARAAIEAMRNTTDSMEEAADEPVHAELKKQGQFSIEKYGKLAFASYPFSVAVWKAMIDAALKEE